MRRVNEAVIHERHMIPKLDELLQDINGATVFSKIDLTSGYHQLQLCEESKNLTAFATHKGIFQYTRLIFGINNASEIFQQAIEDTLAGCEGQFNISDDIFVFGKDQAEHDKRLNDVLSRLFKRGLRVNFEKCIFSAKELVFSGFTLSGKGISPDRAKVQAIHDARPPRTATEVRSFLGLVNYCSRFIKDYSTLTAPLRQLTKKNVPFHWGKREQEAFESLKTSLTSDEVMAYYNPSAETVVIVDGSPVGVGAILTQKQDDASFRPVAYGSKALTPTQSKYSQTEREALAVLFACQKYHYYLHGMHFDIITDHKPLLGIYSPTANPPPRIEKWALKLQPYDFTLRYQPGHLNITDFMSRSPSEEADDHLLDDNDAEHYVNMIVDHAVPKTLMLEEIAEASSSDIQLQQVRKSISSGQWVKTEKIKPYFHCRSELSVKGNIILKDKRIVIPENLHQRTLAIAHKRHQGIVKTKALLREKVWWPGMDRQIESLIKSCHACQVTAQPTVKCEPLKMSEIPKSPWEVIALDLQGLYPTGDYLLVVIDYRSRYPIVRSLWTIESDGIVKELEDIFAMFGLPKMAATDNGANLISREFNNFMDEYGVCHRVVTPYWPSANGEVERFNRVLRKANQTAHVEGRLWLKELDKFLLSYRTTPHCVTGYPPATVMFGRNVRNKLPSFEEDNGSFPDLDSKDKVMKERIKNYADKATRVKEIDAFKPGDKVLLHTTRYQNKLSTIWQNKIYRVVKMCGRSVLVQDEHGKQFFRNAAHVKKYFSNPAELYKNDRYDSSDIFFSNFSKSQASMTNSNACQNVPITI